MNEAATARAEALMQSAQAHRDGGDLASALRDQTEAVTLLRSGSEPGRLAHALRHLADMLVQAGRPTEASPLYREMLANYRIAPDTPPLSLANAVRSLAVHRERLGERDQALQLWQEARDRYRALDDELRAMTGSDLNPGVAEAEAHILRLQSGR